MSKRREVNARPIKRRAARLAALIAAAAVLAWLVWGNSALVTTRISVASPRIPREFDGFLIAHVSDMHDVQLGADNAALIDRLAESAPDIIVITGDLIDSNRTDIDLALSFARRAVELAPVYYVTGNHEGALMEYWRLREGLTELGVHVLTDTFDEITRGGAAIRLVGIDDPNFATHDEIKQGFDAMIREKLSRLTAAGEYSVLLAHRPEYVESYAAGGVDLALCGHAHGGQVRLPLVGGLIAPGQGFLPKYDSGLYTLHGTSMVVSRGLGNSVFPLRVNNRPELVLVTLESDNPET